MTTKAKKRFDLDEADKGFTGAKGDANEAKPPPSPPLRSAETEYQAEKAERANEPAVPELLIVSTGLIVPSPFNPRKNFDKAAMAELVADVDARGILQPLVVRRTPDSTNTDFEIIFGHRRFEAAKQAGLKTVPVLVREAT